MFGKQCYSEINEPLNRSFMRKKPLIAVHRGIWGGNIIENTIASFRLSNEMGADMFECDVAISTDGVLYAIHDGYEKRMLGIERNIETLSSEEIEGMTFFNSIGEPSGVHIERFEAVPAFFKNGELYNVDRAWNKLPETVSILNRYPWSIRQALIKSPVRRDILDYLNACREKYMFMPIVYSMAEVDEVLSYTDINTVGIELIAVTQNEEVFSDDSIRYIHDRGLFVWVNSITLSSLPQNTLFGGLDDDTALLKSKDASWGVLFQKGIDVIQTDWPFQLKMYRDGIKVR